MKKYEEMYIKNFRNRKKLDFEDFEKQVTFYLESKKDNKSKGIYVYKDPDASCDYYDDMTKFLEKQRKRENIKGTFTYQEKSPLAILYKDSGKEFYLYTDQFGFSAIKDTLCDGKHPYGKYFIACKKDLSIIAKCVNDTRTIGGSFIWPFNNNMKKKLNMYKGNNTYIEDRVDLTLWEIKHFYDKLENGKAKDIKQEMKDEGFILLRYDDADNICDWLMTFKTFEDYVKFFCFEGNFVRKVKGKLKIVDILNSKISLDEEENKPEYLEDNIENNNINIKDLIKKLKNYKKNKKFDRNAEKFINIEEIKETEVLRQVLNNVRLLTLMRSEEIENIPPKDVKKINE